MKVFSWVWPTESRPKVCWDATRGTQSHDRILVWPLKLGHCFSCLVSTGKTLCWAVNMRSRNGESAASRESVAAPGGGKIRGQGGALPYAA